MPMIEVTLTKEAGGLSKSAKAMLAAKLTEALVEVVGRGEKTCVVTIHEIPTDNYAIGGKTVTAIRKKAAKAKISQPKG